jgi:hypothetical protein
VAPPRETVRMKRGGGGGGFSPQRPWVAGRRGLAGRRAQMVASFFPP